MTEANQNSQNNQNTDDKGVIAQAQERVSGAATGVVEAIKANPATAAAVAVGAAAAVAGVVYRDKVAEAVSSVRGGGAENNDEA